MTISIGSPGFRMGPGHVLETLGAHESKSGTYFNKFVVVRLMAYIRPYWKKMFFAFVLMVTGSIFTLLTPYLIKIAIDQYISLGLTDRIPQISLWISLSVIGLYLSTAGQRYLLSWVGQRVLLDIRGSLFRHLQKLSLSYHDTHIVGVSVSRVINDVAEINELLSQGVITLLGDLIILSGTIIVMLNMNVKLALLTFTVIPLMILATYIFGKQARKAFRETRTKIAAVVGDLAEDIASVRVIQAFAKEEDIQERFRKINEDNKNAQIKAISLSFVFLPTVDLLSMLSICIVLWFGAIFVSNGEVTIGVLVAFLAYVNRFFVPIQELSRIFTTMQSAMAGGEQIIKLLDTTPDVKDYPDAIDMPPIRGDIEFEKVSFQYRPDTPLVLHDVDLFIAAGSTVALVGPTGAGKTSIANLIARFYDVTEGSVKIDGLDVRSVKQHSLRQQTGLVPQDPFLFSGTIADNIRYGAPGASDSDIIRAAKLAYAHDFIEQMPEGYKTKILEGGVNLSLGQRQLICISRAILADPKIIILDEATANVDTVTENLIQSALNNLLRNRTAVVIAHRLSTIRNADLICVVQDGTIIEQGTHTELYNLSGIYSKLYDRQFIVGVEDDNKL